MKILLACIATLSAFIANAQPGIAWQKNLGGSLNDECRSITNTADGGFFHIGRSNSSDIDIPSNQGSYDLFVMKH